MQDPSTRRSAGSPLLMTGRVILAAANRFAVRASNGQVRLFHLVEGAAFDTATFIDLASSRMPVTVVYQPAPRGAPQRALRIHLGMP